MIVPVIRRPAVAAVTAAAAVAAGAVVAASLAQEAPPPAPPATRAQAQPPYRWFDPIIDLRAVIVNGFVDDVDAEAMQRAALEGMAAALGDPNSAFLPPEDERLMRERMSGSFVGIGVELALGDGRPVVVSALDDSPAQAAGLLPGDALLSVDGRDTLGMGTAGLEALLPGEPGTDVTLELRSPDGSERRVTVRRALIETPSVKGIARDGDAWRHVIDAGRRICYVRIAAFSDRTAEELDAALASMRAGGLSGLVLDLRDNGGGSLDAAIQSADRFLRGGAIVSLRGRGSEGRSWDAADSPDDVDVPLVVLVNQGSASASEVMAGALRDHGRARLVGTRTFGKGSVQEVRPLADGAGAMKLTTARYYLPGGTSVSRLPGEARWGVEPETGFRVAMSLAEAREAGELRMRREAAGTSAVPAGPAATDWSSPASIRSDAKDPQLAAALETLQGYLANGEWEPVGDLSGDVGAGNDELRASLERRRALRAQLAETDERISALRSTGAGIDDPLLAGDAPLIDGELVLRDRTGAVVGRWIVKDPAALRGAISGAAVPGPEYTPAVEPEGK
jgi:carboxyl-terminal processing protease